MSPIYQPGDEPVPGYRLIAHLGQGGFGDVWKATAPGGFEVALKVIRLDRKQGQREFRSMKLMKRVRHANLVPIMALWLKDEEGNIVDDESDRPTRTASPEEQTMSYEEVAAVVQEPQVREPAELVIAMGLGSASLNDRLDECKDADMEGIPSDELLRYMEDSARAIDYLNSATHDLGAGAASIQHGDVKPHNILIVGGTAQVCDFGLARVMGAGARTTSMPAMTVAYASPETLLHNHPSHASDLYSLAITYVDLRTGALPFRSETLPGVTRAIVKGQLDLSRLTPAEQSVIRRATAFDPDKRYASAVEMVKDLRAAIEEKKFAAAPASGKRKVVIGAVCGVVVLAGALAWALVPFGSGGDNSTTDNSDVAVNREADIKASIKRGEQLMMEGKDREAAAAFTEALNNDVIDAHTPLAATAYFGRAQCKVRLDEKNSAMADLRKAQRHAPNRYADYTEPTLAHLAHGTRSLDTGDYAAAVDELTKVIETIQNDPTPFIRRGYANYRLDEYAHAIDDYKNALSLEESAVAYHGLGAAQFGSGNIDEALDNFNRGLEVARDPSYEAKLRKAIELAHTFLRQSEEADQPDENQDGLERIKNDQL